MGARGDAMIEITALVNVAVVILGGLLALSLAASVLVEAASNALSLRASLLRDRLVHALGGDGGTGFVAGVLDGPLLTGLAAPGRLPSYIPAEAFAQAVLARVAQDPALPAALRDLVQAQGIGPEDRAAFQAAVIAWYDRVVARLSGAYARRARLMLFAAGLGLAVALNLDALALVEAIWTERGRLEALAQVAADLHARLGVTPDPADPATRALLAELAAVAGSEAAGLHLPLGWGPGTRMGFWTPVGWGLTALAVVPGAGLWFDLLGRALAIRGSLRPAVPAATPD